MSMLVVHCDVQKLKQDRLYLDSEVRIMRSLASILSGGKATIEVIDGMDIESLRPKLSALVVAGRRFDVVLLIGHSNASGIRIASDHEAGFVDWNAVTEILLPFSPRRLVLAACKAGRWSAAEALFRGVDSLQQIIACPVNASKSLARVLIPVALFALDAPIPKQLVTVAQSVGVVFGGQVRHWERSDMNDPSGQVLDPFAELMQPGVALLSALITTTLGDFFKNT